MLRRLGIEDGDPVEGPPPRAFRTIILRHASHGGGLRFFVELEDEVRAEDPIAEIVDVFGHVVETIEAGRDGFVLRKMLLGSVATGAEVAWIAS